jgi:hypothetical protein
MFSSCMTRCSSGGLGRVGKGSFGCDGSINVNSAGNSSCWLDSVTDDSEANDASDEESSSDGMTVDGVMVSVLGRVTKRPPTLGCVIQARVTR